jgi:aconitase A
MVLTHVESDHDHLHITYYETNLHKEGLIELTLTNPADRSKVHAYDTVDIEDVDNFFPGKPVVLTVHHPDGRTDQVSACCSCDGVPR